MSTIAPLQAAFVCQTATKTRFDELKHSSLSILRDIVVGPRDQHSGTWHVEEDRCDTWAQTRIGCAKPVPDRLTSRS